MGNRAVITTEDKKIGVYLHWNGGRDSIEAFLLYCKLQGYRCPEHDCYGWARLCQVIGNFFGGGLSLGIDTYDRLDTDNGDNGVYIIRNWEIVGREFASSYEQSTYNLREMLEEINKTQPPSEQLSIGTLDQAVEKQITDGQIKLIHILTKDLSWSSERYKELLDVIFKVGSCKELTEKQAETLITILKTIKGE